MLGPVTLIRPSRPPSPAGRREEHTGTFLDSRLPRTRALPRQAISRILSIRRTMSFKAARSPWGTSAVIQPS